jgi:hypothetical protein
MKTTRLFLGTALSTLLASCFSLSTATAQIMPIAVAHTLPTSEKVDLTCTVNGECTGSLNFSAGYVLNSITCLTGAGEYFYGYADISAGGTNTRKFLSPNYVSPRYYWLQSSKYMTIDENVDQPANQVNFHLNLGNGIFSSGGWAQCYSIGGIELAPYHQLYDYGHYYHHHYGIGRAAPIAEQLNRAEVARIEGQLR